MGKNSIKRVSGMTLVSLMIGAMINVFLILAGVTMYRVYITEVTVLARSTSHNSQLNFVFEMLKKELSNTAYGVAGGQLSNVIDMRTQAAIRDLYWAYLPSLDDTQMLCRGLRQERVNNGDGDDTVRLSLIQARPNQCVIGADLSVITWEVTEEIARFSHEDLSRRLDDGEYFMNYGLSTANCAPFGLGEMGATNYRLSVSALSSVALEASATEFGVLQTHVCLGNVRAI